MSKTSRRNKREGNLNRRTKHWETNHGEGSNPKHKHIKPGSRKGKS